MGGRFLGRGAFRRRRWGGTEPWRTRGLGRRPWSRAAHDQSSHSPFVVGSSQRVPTPHFPRCRPHLRGHRLRPWRATGRRWGRTEPMANPGLGPASSGLRLACQVEPHRDDEHEPGRRYALEGHRLLALDLRIHGLASLLLRQAVAATEKSSPPRGPWSAASISIGIYPPVLPPNVCQAPPP